MEIKPMLFNIEELIEKANDGDKLSCYIVARSYDSAENRLSQDLTKAVEWYRKGAEMNDPKCIYGIAACYQFGDGVEQNLELADYYLELAASVGLPRAIKKIEDVQNTNEKGARK